MFWFGGFFFVWGLVFGEILLMWWNVCKLGMSIKKLVWMNNISVMLYLISVIEFVYFIIDGIVKVLKLYKF